MVTVTARYVVDFFHKTKKTSVVCVDVKSSHQLLALTLERENPLPYRMIRCHIYNGNNRGKRIWTFIPS